MASDHSAADGLFDAAIIGAGVIGCAIARRLTLDGARVVVVEKAPDILDGASKGNSGILHTGFDAPTGSLEAACMRAGYTEYLEIRERLNLPLDRCGALVLAFTDGEEARLAGLMDQARRNGIDDVEALDSASTRRLEPAVSAKVRGSLRVPREFLIDPWSAPHAYLLQALVNGAVLVRNCEVTGGEFSGQNWALRTERGSLVARYVVNAAGLYGDRVDQLLTGTTDFTIRPRKGQFVVYDKPAAALTRHILLPVPSNTTKGIVVCRTAFGNLLVGPTAEEQEDRSDARLVPDTLRSLTRRGADILPALAAMDPIAAYAGLRPASEHKDYRVSLRAREHYICVGGIRSTGLTAALGIARLVRDLIGEAGFVGQPLADPAWPRLNTIAEAGPRDFESPGNGGIVCHCERVTRREIESAFADRLSPNAFGGLKRRTRVTMGRCQGFYCSAELAAITRGRFTEPMIRAGAEAPDAT